MINKWNEILHLLTDTLTLDCTLATCVFGISLQ